MPTGLGSAFVADVVLTFFLVGSEEHDAGADINADGRWRALGLRCQTNV